MQGTTPVPGSGGNSSWCINREALWRSNRTGSNNSQRSLTFFFTYSFLCILRMWFIWSRTGLGNRFTRSQNGTRHSLLSQSSFIYLPDQRLFFFLWRIYVYIRISDSIETVYELPLLPNNTRSETFLHKSGAVRIVVWLFITGEPVWRWLGE